MAFDGDNITLNGRTAAATAFAVGGQAGRVVLSEDRTVTIQIAGQPEIVLPAEAADALASAIDSHHLGEP